MSLSDGITNTNDTNGRKHNCSNCSNCSNCKIAFEHKNKDEEMGDKFK